MNILASEWKLQAKRRRIRWRDSAQPCLLIVFFLVSNLVEEASAAGLKLGVRAGYADLEGDLFDGAEALGHLKLYGAQVVFPFLTHRLSVEVAGEGVSEDLEFSFEGVEDSQDAEWNDIALYATGRVQLLPPGLLGFYAGAGVGVHFTEIEAQGLDAVGDELRDRIRSRIDEERNEFEWNAVAGANIGFGGLLEVFGEGRYRDVTGDFGREGYAVYAGLNLVLP